MASQDFQFEARTKAFFNWFSALPGATFHPSIQITDLRPRNAGRGIIATADIPAETTLFTIPRPAIICTSTSDLPSIIPPVFTPPDADPDALTTADEDGSLENASANQDSWTRLILVLLYEYFKGPQSKWAPYLEILPETFNTPMFWEGAEINELQASSVVQRIGAQEADEMIATKIIPVVQANEGVFFPQGRGLEWDDERIGVLARRMGSTIMAYAFDLEPEEDEDEDEQEEWVEDREGKTELGMVPMADVLNADAEFNAHINHGEDALTAVSLREIKAGEEVLNYYGPLANGELLRRYGYVTPKHARWDVVELSWDLVSAGLREVLGVSEATWGKVVEKIDDEEVEDGFVLEWGSEEPDAEGRVNGNVEFHGLPEELSEQVKAFLKVLKKVDVKSAQNMETSEQRKEAYLRGVLRALEARTAQYPSSLEADLNLQRSQRPEGRLGMALAVRIGEKNLLREAARWIGSELSKMDQDVTMADEPSAKRQRHR